MNRSLPGLAPRWRKGLAATVATGLIASGAALIVPTSALAEEAISLAPANVGVYSHVTEFVYGEPIDVFGLASPSLGASGMPSGEISLSDGTIVLATDTLDEHGIALFPAAIVPPLTTELFTIYGGDAYFAAGESAPHPITMLDATTSTQMSIDTGTGRAGDLTVIDIVSTSDAPSIADPQGIIELLVDGDVVERIAVGDESNPTQGNGVTEVALYTATLPAGEHEISVRLDAGPGFVGSSSDPETIVLNPWATTLSATSAPTAPRVGDDVTITASVTLDEVDTIEPGHDVPTAWGMIQAYIDGVAVGQPVEATEVPSTLTLTGLAAGDHDVLLVYTPSRDQFEAAEASFTVNVAPAANVKPAPDAASGGSALAKTGTTLEYWPIAGGALLLAGALLLMLRRRFAA